MILCLGQLRSSCRKIGFRRTQLIQLVLRFEARYHFSGFYPIAELGLIFEQSTGDSETECHLVLGLYAACQGNRRSGFVFLDGNRSNRTRLRRSRF